MAARITATVLLIAALIGSVQFGRHIGYQRGYNSGFDAGEIAAIKKPVIHPECTAPDGDCIDISQDESVCWAITYGNEFGETIVQSKTLPGKPIEVSLPKGMDRIKAYPRPCVTR